MPYFTHRGYRFHYRTQGDHPLMWSRPNEFRAISGWFLNSIRDRC